MEEDEYGEPQTPEHHLFHPLDIQHTKDEDELVEDEVPELVFQMLLKHVTKRGKENENQWQCHLYVHIIDIFCILAYTVHLDPAMLMLETKLIKKLNQNYFVKKFLLCKNWITIIIYFKPNVLTCSVNMWEMVLTTNIERQGVGVSYLCSVSVAFWYLTAWFTHNVYVESIYIIIKLGFINKCQISCSAHSS